VRDSEPLFGWASAVDLVIRGEIPDRPIFIVGPSPARFAEFGLRTGALTFSVEKMARCRREHPEVPLAVWYDLPNLLREPLAIFPSMRRDGSYVVLLVVKDRDQHPVVVAVTSGRSNINVVLSIYGKRNGYDWAAKQIAYARSEGLKVYEKLDFAASLPQPPVAETTSSSNGPIPIDGTAKPTRQILSISKKSSEC
jgi:Phage MuF-C-terminal domain